jgi:hypothetical protein
VLLKSLAGSTSLLVLALIFALLTAVPVNCACNSGQHLGHAVHSLLPHHHEADPAAALGAAAAAPLGPSVSSLVGPPGGELLGVAADGLQLNTGLLGLLLLPLLGWSRPALAYARPREYLRGPPTEPPRPALLI